LFCGRDVSRLRTLGAGMQAGDERFNGDEIHRLYDSGDYPLPRRAPDQGVDRRHQFDVRSLFTYIAGAT
jgi:hypothetical protein